LYNRGVQLDVVDVVYSATISLLLVTDHRDLYLASHISDGQTDDFKQQ